MNSFLLLLIPAVGISVSALVGWSVAAVVSSKQAQADLATEQARP